MTPRTLEELADAGEIDRGWATALAPAQGTISALGDFLRAEHTRWAKLAKDVGVVPE